MLETSTNGAGAAHEAAAAGREDQGAGGGVLGMTFEIGGGSPDPGP
jgi:hypothetical protein